MTEPRDDADTTITRETEVETTITVSDGTDEPDETVPEPETPAEPLPDEVPTGDPDAEGGETDGEEG